MKAPNAMVLTIVISIQSLCAKDQLTLKTGEEINGYLQGMDGGYVSLSDEADNWQRTRRFAPDSIERFYFDDDATIETAKGFLENDDYENALVHLNPLIDKRLPYLAFLTKDDETLFVAYLQCLGETKQRALALDRIKVWKPLFKETKNQKTLERLSLKLAWESGHSSEAKLIAEQLIENGYRASEDPTPWMILAHGAFENGDIEKTLWLSLQPISFGAVDEALDLNACYALALLAAKELDNRPLAQKLEIEMNERGLNWPQNLSRTPPVRAETLSVTQIDPTQKRSKIQTLNQIYQTIGQP